MQSTTEKLRSFFVRSARDVASQALPNWAQIGYSLAQNFYDIFVACADAEQQALLQCARQVSAQEWASIRGQVAGELGEQYAEALDQARQAMQGVSLGGRGSSRGGSNQASQRQEAFRQGLEQSMRLNNMRVERRRRVGSGVARSMMMASQRSAVPPRSAWPQIPGFELTGWLGEGAQAKVFIAKREGAGDLVAPVALKVGVLSDRKRFESEVRLMTELRSPNLLSALSYGIIEGFAPLFWIEMPLMGGHSLADVGKVSLEEGVKLCLGVIEGLKALHQAGVAHRDLKPSNVLLSASGEVKLADFGLSKKMSDAGASVTETGVMGSPAYMSPEAIKGKPKLASDIWALGVLLCEVLTGHLPFNGDVAGVMWASILRDEPQLKDVPQWLERGIKACLNKDVSKRLQNASKLSSILETPMRKYLAELERNRELDRTRLARIEELRGQIRTDEEIEAQVLNEFVQRIEAMSSVKVVKQLEPLSQQYKQRIQALEAHQIALKNERSKLETRDQSRNERYVTSARLRAYHIPEWRPKTLSGKVGGFMGMGGSGYNIDCQTQTFKLGPVEFTMVRIPNKDYALSQTQVTQELYGAVIGTNPSTFKGGKLPVENVSWEDGITFCNALSEKLGLTPAYKGTDNNCELVSGANGFRLPFEAEWAFTAKGGMHFNYAGSNNIDEVAWYINNSGSKTHEVAKKKPNGYGLYDMSGNVWEWCADDYNNPGQHRLGASKRVYRGGSWANYGAGYCGVSYRGMDSPDYRYYRLGLRLSRSLG